MADKGKFSYAMNISNETEGNKAQKSLDSQPQQQTQVVPPSITRERSFVRTPNQQNINKRRSLAFNAQTSGHFAGNMQMRAKPIMDVYGPPHLNYNLEHSSSSSVVYPTNATAIQYVSAANSMFHNVPPQQARVTLGSTASMHLNAKQHHLGGGGGSHRPLLLSHSHTLQMNPITGGMMHHIPLMTSPSSGNVLHQANRVKFAPEPKKSHKSYVNSINNIQINNPFNQNFHVPQHQLQSKNVNKYQAPSVQQMNQNGTTYTTNSLQRSKSLSSADALTRGIAGLGLGLSNDVTDIGQFTPEVKSLIDVAVENPNKLNSRSLMELSSHFIKRAVECRRYALPISRLCLNIIAKEKKETFLEAILNTCRQWYQEREKLLFAIQGMKSPSRASLTSFMAFLTEMFCQLKRRQLQLSTQSEVISPPLVLLILLSKCCEDCVKPPVKSLSEIECLYYVLTCIGQDMEVQLPQQLQILLSMIRDAFLNASDSAPTIRRTLLQLIELQASHWQLPGNTVLYYYPSVK